MQCFRIKVSILVTPLHYVTSASNCVTCKRILGVYKKTQRTYLNVFCLPVYPLSFRHNFDSCGARLYTTLTRTTPLCKLKMARSNKTRREVFNCGLYSPIGLLNTDLNRTLCTNTLSCKTSSNYSKQMRLYH